MTATVDREACIGCGLCADTCPKVFHMDDEGIAVAIDGPVPADAEATCTQAAEGCPVGAIALE